MYRRKYEQNIKSKIRFVKDEDNNLKRARKKNSSAKLPRKELSGYTSDMIDLGYDPNAEEIIENIGENADEDNIENNDEAENNLNDEENSDEAEESSSDEVKRTAGKKPVIFIAALLTVIFIFVIAFGFGGFTSPEEETAEENYTVPVEKGTGKINILLLGVDKDGLRSDTIILASYDMDVNTVKLLSIPRDTRMYVGNKYQKINAAHAISQNGKIKGVQGSIEAVTRLTLIPVNYYVEFSFDAFKNTIDALGGVDFDVPQNMNYEDPTQDLYIHLTKGFQHLDGDKAEQLVRFRSYPMGDIARVEMQQSFIKAIAEQKLNAGIITDIPDLYNVLKEDIKTNFTLADVIKYANNLAELSAENITMFQLPGQFGGGEYITSYWIADMEQVKTLVETEFGYDAENATIDSADGSSKSKDSADRRKTSSPEATSKNKATAKPTAEATATPTEAAPTQKSTQKPTESTHKPTTAPEVTQKPTAAPTEAPTVKPTEKPNEEATKKPSRPTANPENE